MMFNAAGSPYAMEYKDASVYAAPYEESEASIALATTMDKVGGCRWEGVCFICMLCYLYIFINYYK